ERRGERLRAGDAGLGERRIGGGLRRLLRVTHEEDDGRRRLRGYLRAGEDDADQKQEESSCHRVAQDEVRCEVRPRAAAFAGAAARIASRTPSRRISGNAVTSSTVASVHAFRQRRDGGRGAGP